MTHAPDRPQLSFASRAKLLVVLTALGVLCAVGWIYFSQRDRLVIPDEKAAAAALLEEKLSGPRYFTATAPATDPREPVIAVADAQAQVARIAAERHPDAEHAAKIYELIDRLTEPPDSRIVGDATINLLRLNLALDAQR